MAKAKTIEKEKKTETRKVKAEKPAKETGKPAAPKAAKAAGKPKASAAVKTEARAKTAKPKAEAKAAAKKKPAEASVSQQIKTAQNKGVLMLGSRTVLKGVKNGKTAEVFYAINTPEATLKDLEYYSRISGVSLKKFDGNSAQLGELCGKPFKILLTAVKK